MQYLDFDVYANVTKDLINTAKMIDFMTENKKDPADKPQRQIKKNTQLAPRYEIVELLKTARKAQDILFVHSVLDCAVLPIRI